MGLFISILLIVTNIVISNTESIGLSHPNNMLLSPASNIQQNLQSVQDLASRLKQSGIANLRDVHNWNDYHYKINPKDMDVDMDMVNYDIFNDFDDLQVNDIDDMDIKKLSNFLSSLLTQPTWENPLVIVEDPILSDESDEDLNELEMPIEKRSRHYRQYPWKRQNSRSRSNFDYDSLHLCTPSRQDVFELLVALHDVRQGNKSRTVNFCKRRRPVSTVFTNIRFLGRKK